MTVAVHVSELPAMKLSEVGAIETDTIPLGTKTFPPTPAEKAEFRIIDASVISIISQIYVLILHPVSA